MQDRGKAQYDGAGLRIASVVEFPIPDDVTYVYIYNAFTGPVFQRVLDELIASVERRPRPVRLLYRTPREHQRVARTGRFRLERVITGWRPTRDWASLTAINVYELKGSLAAPLVSPRQP